MVTSSRWLLWVCLALVAAPCSAETPASLMLQAEPGGLEFVVPLPPGPIEAAEARTREAQRRLPTLGTDLAPASAAAARLSAFFRRQFTLRDLNTAEAAFSRRVAQSSAGGGGDRDDWNWSPPSREDEHPETPP